MICVSWKIFLLFSWVPHDHRHYHHRFFLCFFLFLLLVIYQSSPAFSQRFSKGDGMVFTNWPLVSTIMLPVCDNATLFIFYVLILFFFPLDHTNPYLVSTPPSSLALLFCFLWFPLVLSVHLSLFFIVLVWWLYAWWMFDTWSDGRWHRDFASCPCSLRHFISSTPRLKSLCW